VLSVAIAAGTALLLRLRGPELSHAVRERLLLLWPVRGLKTAAVVVIAVFALSAVAAGVRRYVGPVSARLAGVQRSLSGVTRPSAVVGLTAIVSVAAAVRVLLARPETEPKVFGDEVIYTQLAKNIAQHGVPLLGGQVEIGYSVLYPAFLSPAYRFASDGAAAFAAVKTMNAVTMALTAVPTYLLARRVLSQGWSLGLATLVVFEPWMGYASLAMTEALFLPAFTAFALALALMLERPTVRRQLLVFLALALLVGVRPQALVLAGSIVVAVALKALPARSGREVVRDHLVVFGGLALALVAALIALTAGVSLPGASAGPLLTLAYNPLGLAKWALWNLAIYELGLGVIALAAFPLALRGLLRRSASDRERSVGIVSLTLAGGLLVSVTALSSSKFGLGILHERNLFYATPLVLVCLGHWLASGLQRPVRLALTCAAAAVMLPAILPNHLVRITNNVDSPTAAWFAALEHQTSWTIKETTVGVAAVGAAALVVARRPLGPILAPVLAFVALAAPLDYSGALTPEQDHALAWVDRALPAGATATLVHLGLSRPDQPCSRSADADQRTLVVWTEFFNARVDRVAYMSEPMPDGVPSPKLTVATGGIVHKNGRPFGPRYAVLDSRQPVVGQRLARFDLARLGLTWQGGASLSLWKVIPPLGFLAHAQPLPPRANGREC